MLRKEMLIRLKLERKPHLLTQWQERGLIGKVVKNKDGKYVYTEENIALAKNHMRNLLRVRKGKWVE